MPTRRNHEIYIRPARTLVYRNVILTAVCAGALNLTLTPQVEAQTKTAARHGYNIAAGSLSPALRHLASSAGILLSFTENQTADKVTSGIQGTYTPQAALAALLVGTGLSAVALDNGGYVLRPTPANSGISGSTSDNGEAIPVLSAITATSSIKTEGTGSYTAENSNTATGFDLSLRDTPQSVTVFTRQRMEDEKLDSLGKVLDMTPGVSLVRAGSSGSPAVGEIFYARGFEITNYMIDGMPTNQLGLQAMAGTRSGIGGTSTAIYDNVTVVRGATGLLNGAGNPAAAINLIRKRPTADFQGSVDLTAGRWGRYGTQIDLSGPLNEDKTIRGRIVADGGMGGEWMDRHRDAKDGVLYGVLEADLTPSTLLTLGIEYSRNKDRGISFNNFARVDTDGRPTYFSRTANASPAWAFADVKRTNLFATLDHRFDNGWKAQLSVHHTRLNHDQVFGLARGDIDAETGASSFEYGRNRFTPKTTGISLNASGPFHLLGREHELMVGLNHENLHAVDPAYQYTFGVPVDNIYDFANTGDITVPPPARTGTAFTRIRQTGAYAATRLRPMDGVAVIAGARVTNYRERSNYTDIKESNVITPYVGIVVDLNKQLSAYASYTTIFNPQSNRDRDGKTLDPEEGKNYEVGLKGEFLDGRLNASAAMFWTRKNNLALLDDGFVTPDGEDAYIAADDTKARGYELELSGEIARNWQLMAAYTQTFVRAKDGQRLMQDTPARQIKLYTSYAFSGQLSGLTLGGGLIWQSRTSHPYDDNPALNQGSITLLSLLARYQINPNLSATVNVSNLTNKKYLSTIWYHNYGTPRNITATLQYRF